MDERFSIKSIVYYWAENRLSFNVSVSLGGQGLASLRGVLDYLRTRMRVDLAFPLFELVSMDIEVGRDGSVRIVLSGRVTDDLRKLLQPATVECSGDSVVVCYYEYDPNRVVEKVFAVRRVVPLSTVAEVVKAVESAFIPVSLLRNGEARLLLDLVFSGRIDVDTLRRCIHNKTDSVRYPRISVIEYDERSRREAIERLKLEREVWQQR